MTEAHMFVDGVRRGHTFHGGCSLRFGGNSFPAVARVAPGKVLVIDDCARNVSADTLHHRQRRDDDHSYDGGVGMDDRIPGNPPGGPAGAGKGT